MSATETTAAAPAQELDTSPVPDGGAATAPKLEEGFRVYVGNLPYSATEEQVRGVLEPAGGELLSVALPQKFGRPAGYAFASYKSEEDAKKVVEQLNGHELGERKLLLEVARSKEEAAEARKVSQDKRAAARAAKAEERAAAKGEKGETTAAEGEATTEGEGKPKKKRSGKKRDSRRRQPGEAEDGELAPTQEHEEATAGDPTALAAIANESKQPKKARARKPKEPKQARIDGAEGDETLVEKDKEAHADQESKPKRERKKREPKLELTGEASKSTIFVANLPFNLDDEGLAALFTNLSIAVKSAKVIKGVRHGKQGTRPFRASKGFGFVEVEDPAQQQEAVDKIEGSLVGDRKISAKIANEMKPIEKEAAAAADAEIAA